jgi:hypothetical protein
MAANIKLFPTIVADQRMLILSDPVQRGTEQPGRTGPVELNV